MLPNHNITLAFTIANAAIFGIVVLNNQIRLLNRRAFKCNMQISANPLCHNIFWAKLRSIINELVMNIRLGLNNNPPLITCNINGFNGFFSRIDF